MSKIKTRKVTLLSIISLTSIAIGTLCFANLSDSFFNISASYNSRWYHYLGVEPTEEMNGCKEYWTNCSGTTTIVNPEYGDIVEMGVVSDSFLSQLDKDDERYIQSINEKLGITPVIDLVNKIVTYGLYPQTHVNDSSLIAALDELESAESNGWYLYNGEYYAKTSAVKRDDEYNFRDGTKVISEAIYWFKCETIKWNILSLNSYEYFLLSSVLLDTQIYNSKFTGPDEYGRYPNNYEYSFIRSWLNDEFLNSAFALDNTYINTTLVDNSGSTTSTNYNDYACNDTLDKIFLPSYKDYLNEDYGFDKTNSISNTRTCKTTDYTIAKGASFITYTGTNQYNGRYYTRSPSGSLPDYICYVDYSGGIGSGCPVSADNFGIRPSVILTIV